MPEQVPPPGAEAVVPPPGTAADPAPATPGQRGSAGEDGSAGAPAPVETVYSAAEAVYNRAPRANRSAGSAASSVVALLRRTATVALLLALIPVAGAVLVAVTVLGAPVSSLTRGPWRQTRFTGFALLYLLVDLAGLALATALFLRDPCATPAARGRRQVTAFAALARLLALLRRTAARVFRLRVEITPALPPRDGPHRTPLLVLVRHAGLGDSFLLLQVLLTEAGLLPHTVLKGMLRADPCLDVLLGRVPHRFLPPASGTATDGIASLAAGLRAGDALVLFPEGGNFTPRRHRRAIAGLRRRGLRRRADRASRLHYVLPPRDGGALAALAAAPTADVVFVTHAGLDIIDSPRAAWSALPLRRPVRAHWWRIPAAAVPPGQEARSEWLLAQWERVDRWTAAHAVAQTPHV
ncbi:lysophospholipid acyltransferase family protein [Actinacidiphila yanglinensis]|uniref:1-acyl-sn-glycerol-3-phosphate acyltransferase n=1 Tax=Actinacidiphila yanglinensis TaxID=310779 RepID=UPI001F38FB46|nr:1-acyl-sn-glycerol-3-phosphate acyltransferase [Actinacidiphila yanglinensis]